MISARIGPDFRMAVVAAPSYFVSRSRPVTPEDLADHACIPLRLPTDGGFAPWEFRKEGRELKVRVQGHAAFNTLAMIRQASLEGFGLAYLPEDLVTSPLEEGRLVRVLQDWCPLRPGYHLIQAGANPRRLSHSCWKRCATGPPKTSSQLSPSSQPSASGSAD